VSITIAVDSHGGDHGVSVTVPAALSVLESTPDLSIILVGKQDALEAELALHKKSFGDRLSIHHATQIVGMDESPASAMRGKKDSSMRVAINLIKEGKADACVSAGNTGALMATARFVLKTLSGIKRPAIVTAIPTMHGHVHLLDLGANVDSSADVLQQFGIMGSILVSAVEGIEKPRVGLLNIGHEDIKGNDTVRGASDLLKNSPVNYVGFVEGDDIFMSDLDVIVCDGFVGNVSLKAIEGLAQMIASFMKQEFKRNVLTKLAALVALPVIRALRTRLDNRRYNGATLLGLGGIVIKSHGSADVYAYSHAIDEAYKEVQHQVTEKIENVLTNLEYTRQDGQPSEQE
jgi:glycerol-3-phosphate acyltransferase PlsX